METIPLRFKMSLHLPATCQGPFLSKGMTAAAKEACSFACALWLELASASLGAAHLQCHRMSLSQVLSE
jgi:hypothetical protein